MNYYIITGTSKGLGKALVELLLKDENNFVYGLSRTSTCVHERYVHSYVDLCDLSAVERFKLPVLKNPKQIVLINNAGMVGDISHVGKLSPKKVIASYNLNLIAPVLLTNSFVAKYESLGCEMMVLNISSGAGRSPVDGWNVYCSTKAGLDMFSEVLNEEKTLNKFNLTVLSLAPGIIDTEMQNQIRLSDSSGFSNVERFINYKKDGALTDPKLTAQQVYRFLSEKALRKTVICSVRDL